MIKHQEIVPISKEELKRYNFLLSIPSLEDMSDAELTEIGAETDVCKGIYFIEFDNGATMNIDLCSGSHNYWDDVVWTSPDGNRDVVLDCEYEISDIEVEIDDELYVVKFEITEEGK